ncbi:hypothetical protein BBP40_001335 [Aspergillus hancockii]|nr:hypothetical protein BBP40_001335 [Aspergillus hancockii]
MQRVNRRVPYGEPLPIGYWHSQHVREMLDYVPRGESWFLPTFVDDPQPPEGEQLGINKPDGHAQESYFKALGSIASAPVDHRLIISIDTDDEKVLKNVLGFVEKLRNHAGHHWIKDFDLHGNSRVYAFGEPLAAIRTRPSSGSFTTDTVEWPEPWHAYAIDHGPCQSCPPKVKAPWRRTVVLEGLSAMDRGIGFRRPCGAQYRPKKGFEQNKQAQIPLLFDISVDWLIEEHIRGTFGIADYTLTSGYAFQVSWLELVEMPDCNAPRPRTNEGLRNGVLYGTEEWRSPKGLLQEVFTSDGLKIYGVPEDSRQSALQEYPSLKEMAANQHYWTILVMASLPHSTEFPGQRAYDDAIDMMQITMVRLITVGLLRAWHGFCSLQPHIDDLLTNGAEIFDPSLHNNLLLDDEVCSQSLKFSWIINTLYEVDRIIEQNIIAWNNCHDRFIGPSMDDARMWTEAEVGKLCRTIERSNEVFLANSILGSRASTRLGENVQLLTFVSIFYLPISFCTSLWSTTSTFSFRTLTYTAVLGSIATYLTVFNLRHRIRASHKKYLRWKNGLIDQMKNDKQAAWRVTAELFDRSYTLAVRSESGPSEWRVAAYFVVKLVMRVGLRNAG